MGPLKNLRHEKFVQALATDPETLGNQTQSYLKTYPDSSLEASRRSASEIMTYPDVKRRFDTVLKDAGLTPSYTSRKLRKHVDSNTENISLDATKFVAKIQGMIDSDDTPQGATTHNHLHLHSSALASLTKEEKLAKLRELIQ